MIEPGMPFFHVVKKIRGFPETQCPGGEVSRFGHDRFGHDSASAL